MYHLGRELDKNQDLQESDFEVLSSRRRLFGLVAGPVLFTTFLLLPDRFLCHDERCVAALASIMAVWWICETIPLAVTALMPVLLLPVLKIAPVSRVASFYAVPEIFLFMGGFLIANAMQRWNLHRRIALWIVCIVGCSGPRLILGFMVATAAISLWVSNTATAMMMFPIVLAVLSTMAEHSGSKKDRFEEFRIALLLGVAYAASIGGVGTLIGSPPNLIFAAQARSLFPESSPISFVRWAALGLPFVVVFLPVAWLILTRVALRGSLSNFRGAEETLRVERRALGSISHAELCVLAVFIAAVVGWVTRSDIDVGAFKIVGWESALGLQGMVHDATVAIAAAIALFVIPAGKQKGAILDWKAATSIPWGILVLFGGGIALGNAILESRLATRMASSIAMLGHASLPLMIASLAAIVSALTEVTSNTAVATIMMPVLAAIAVGMRIHPFALMIPGAISASCAFMMPVATPPNAIAYSTGAIPITGMVRVGLMMNVLGVLIVTLLMYLLAEPIYGELLAGLPVWAVP